MDISSDVRDWTNKRDKVLLVETYFKVKNFRVDFAVVAGIRRQ